MPLMFTNILLLAAHDVLKELIGKCDFNRKYRGLSFVDVSCFCAYQIVNRLIIVIKCVVRHANSNVLAALINHDLIQWTPDLLEQCMIKYTNEVSINITLVNLIN